MTSVTRPSESPGSTAPAPLDEASGSRSFLDDITAMLTREFAAVLRSDVVDECVRQAFRCFRGARIHAYLPVLVHKMAREELARHASRARPSDGDR